MLDQICHTMLCQSLHSRTPAIILCSVLFLSPLRSTISPLQLGTPTSRPQLPISINHHRWPINTCRPHRSTTINPRSLGCSKRSVASFRKPNSALLGRLRTMPYARGRTSVPDPLMSVSRERFCQMSVRLQGWNIEPSMYGPQFLHSPLGRLA